MFQSLEGKTPWILGSVLLAFLSACNSQGGAKAPRISTIPLQSTAAGSSFTLDLSAYVTDDTSTASYSVLSGGGSFTGSVYAGTFPTLGTYTVSFQVSDFRGQASTGSFQVKVTSTEIALVKSGNGVQIYDTKTGDLSTAFSDNGTTKTFKDSLADGSLIFEFSQTGQKDLYLYDPNVPKTLAVAEDSEFDEAYALKTTTKKVLYVKGASPSRSLHLFDAVNQGVIQFTARPSGETKARDEGNPMITASGLIYFESGIDGLMDIYYYDPSTNEVVTVSAHANDETLLATLPNSGVVFSRPGSGGETDLFYYRPGTGLVEIGSDLRDKTVTTNPFTWNKVYKAFNNSSQIVFEGTNGADTDVFFWDPETGTTTSVAVTSDVETYQGVTSTGKVAFKDTVGTNDEDLHLFNPATSSSVRMLDSGAATTMNGSLSNGDVVFTLNAGGTNKDLYLFANGGSADSATAFASNAADEVFAKILSNDGVVYTLSGDVYLKPSGSSASNLTGGTGTNTFASETSGGDFVVSRTVSSQTDLYLWDESAQSLVTVTTASTNEVYQGVSSTGKVLFTRVLPGSSRNDLWVWDPGTSGVTQITDSSEVDESVLAVVTAVVSN